MDDEPDMLSTCEAILSGNGVSVVLENQALGALEKFKKENFDLVVADIKMPKLSGIELLRAIKETNPDLPVILMTAYPEVESAVGALRLGALDYLIKPFHPEDLKRKIQRALEEQKLKGENHLLTRHVEMRYKPAEIIGQSAAIGKILEMADKVAKTNASILILGESGTGKELIARRLHFQSGRRGHFVPVDCGAIPENLLENELFGHERGAYTDAARAAPGLLEFADGGTFFMDEVCELPVNLQAKLLRALQEKQTRRVGGNQLRGVDIRVIAATNRDIAKEVREGRFREDLYWRLNVVAIIAPPLRERREDIPLLIQHFLPQFSREAGKNVLHVEEEALEILCHYRWPGNIRELQNILRKTAVFCEGDAIKAGDLPEFLVGTDLDSSADGEGFSMLKKRTLHAFETDFFESLLEKYSGNAKVAAEAANLPLSNFYWYLKKHHIDPQSFQN